MPARKLEKYATATFDCETDPFLYDRFPHPFACGFTREIDDRKVHFQTWGENCIPDMMAHIAEIHEPLLVYVHNGGKFDFHFLFDYVQEPIFIINSRLIEFHQGRHIWRDSLAIIPVPLKDYQKTEIDYAIMERDRRDIPKNRKQISAYLKDDCDFLFDLVQGFRAEFEDDAAKRYLPLTVGQAAMRELKALHDFEPATKATDALMRPFYHGGRVQCFAGGILPGPWQVYDVNSSYPAAMRNYQHPLTDDWIEYDGPEVPDMDPKLHPVWFAEIDAENDNILPMQTETGTRFDIPRGRFFACSHELIPGIKSGKVRVLKLHHLYAPAETGDFRLFVDTWNARKVRAEKAGSKAERLFAKLILNSAYGKFGQDPARYEQWKILKDPRAEDALKRKGYEARQLINPDPFHWLELWAAPAPSASASYHNVGIAASITSASRAILLAGIQQAREPVYCDTDSLICREFHGDIHPTRLGAWKAELEKPAGFVAIAGRKTYALYDSENIGPRIQKLKPIKTASKGGDLAVTDIVSICKGGTIEQASPVPLFSVKTGQRFIKRKFRQTVTEEGKPINA